MARSHTTTTVMNQVIFHVALVTVSCLVGMVRAVSEIQLSYDQMPSSSNQQAPISVAMTSKYSRDHRGDHPRAEHLRDRDREAMREHQSYSRNYPYPTGGGGGDSWGRQISLGLGSLGLGSMQSSASNDYHHYGSTASGDNYASAGHHHQSYGHGHGHYGKKDCNAALGLLSVLGLASYLQSVLAALTTTTVAPGRKRRGVPEQKSPAMLTSKILPMLSAVGHARDGLIPVGCTRRQVCLANRLVVRELGPQGGNAIAYQITSAIVKMLQAIEPRKLSISKSISKAGKAGRTGYDCEKLFSECTALSQLPVYSIPPELA